MMKRAQIVLDQLCRLASETNHFPITTIVAIDGYGTQS